MKREKKKIFGVALNVEFDELPASEIVRCARRDKKMGLIATNASYFKKKFKKRTKKIDAIEFKELLMIEEISKYNREWADGQDLTISKT